MSRKKYQSHDVFEPQTPETTEAEQSLPDVNSAAGSDQPEDVSWRELFCVILLSLLLDLTFYRGGGYTGAGVFFLLAPWILLRSLGAWNRLVEIPRVISDMRNGRNLAGGPVLLLTAGLAILPLLCLRLFWNGSNLLLFSGSLLFLVLAMAAHGEIPWLEQIIPFVNRRMPFLNTRLKQFSALFLELLGVARLRWLSRCALYLIPVFATLLFALPFAFANPELLDLLLRQLQELADLLYDLLVYLLPDLGEPFFLILAFVGTMLIALRLRKTGPTADPMETEEAPATDRQHLLYAPYRLTLLSLIVLFGIYLCFEFATLWFRTLPEDFDYSGYTHQGAAWLTLTLLMTSLFLSVMFQGGVLQDPRLDTLKQLAWTWCGGNALLGIAVYHRLYLYVAHDGMTWLRTVGFFGTTSVLLGLLVVVWKVHRRQGMFWMIRRQAVTLALVILVFALTPVDTLVHGYNTRRILSGDLSPLGHITRQKISPAGLLMLVPLQSHPDRNVRAVANERLLNWLNWDQRQAASFPRNWSDWQWSEDLLRQRIQSAGFQQARTDER